MKRKGTVYLLHFNKPHKHAQHYIGWTTDLSYRLYEHALGKGARLLEVILESGNHFRLVKTWQGGRSLERRLKNQKHAWKHCPVCRELRARRPDQPELFDSVNV